MTLPLDFDFDPMEGAKGLVEFMRWPMGTIGIIRTANRHHHAEDQDAFGDDWETGKKYEFRNWTPGDFDTYTACEIKDDAGTWRWVNMEKDYFKIRSIA